MDTEIDRESYTSGLITAKEPRPLATNETLLTALRSALVGVDGSDGSRRALEWAVRLASQTGAQVLAVHVLTYDRALVRDLTLDTMRTWRHELKQSLKTGWTEPLAKRGVAYRCLLVESDSPAAGLLEVADREDADLLIVGAKGHRSLADRVLGSVSYRVTHRARQPVVVVPADWSPSESTDARVPRR
jgi:nucleotide-binding universal stress UspA family protein